MTDVFAPKISYKIAKVHIWPGAMFMGGDNPLPNSNWPPHNEPGILEGWAGELTYANTMGFELHFQMYREIVTFINENVKNPKQNCLWNKIGDCIYVQFRKKKDMNWFALRFGA